MDEHARFLLEMCRGIIRAEEDPNVESLTEDDILEETKGMTLTSPPAPEKPLDTWEIMRAPMDVSKEMELLKHACPQDEKKRIRDILEAAGPMRTESQTEFCHERCKVLCSKPEWCPFADNQFTPRNKNDILGG